MYENLMILAVFVMVTLVFIGMFQLVRTEDGYHLVRKENFVVSFPVVDTRDWDMGDWLENADIGKALADIKLESLQQEAKKGWQRFTKEMDSWLAEVQSDIDTGSAKKELERLKNEARKRYEELVGRLEKGTIDRAAFDEKVSELEDWFKKKLLELKPSL